MPHLESLMPLANRRERPREHRERVKVNLDRFKQRNTIRKVSVVLFPLNA
jgi:hypothetical protein